MDFDTSWQSLWTSRLLLAGALVSVGLLFWFIADLNHSMRWSRKKSELDAQGRWKELNGDYEAELRCRRPLVRLFRAVVLPGLLETQYGLHLSNQGEHERGLELTELAVRKGDRELKGPALTLFKMMMPKSYDPARRLGGLSMIFITRGFILQRLGRYEEAKASIAKAQTFSCPPGSAELAQGLIELNLGHLDEALVLGHRAMTALRATDPARALLSGALMAKGRFQEALNVLVYEPSNALAFFTSEDLQLMTKDPQGQSLVLAMDQNLAGVFRPVRHLAIAHVCLEAGDRENFEASLDRAQRELKSHPVVEKLYLRFRACCCAWKGDGPGTEQNLARARAIGTEFPSRSSRYETDQAAGRAYLLLGRTEAALSEFRPATHSALHPMEKHATNYWLARAADAAQRPDEAATAFRLVLADGIDTWMSADAHRRLPP